MARFFNKLRMDGIRENRIGRYFIYAFGEIILVVIGILIALQVNNWNENRIEQKKMKQYAKGLIADLSSDIRMMTESRSQANKKYEYIDSLRVYINQTPIPELSNTFLWLVAHDIMYKPYNWHRSTLNELKSSGGMSYLTNDSIINKLVAYESFSNHLDEDFEFDKSNSDKLDNLSSSLLDLNSPYLTELLELENSDDPFSQIFSSEEYRLSIAHDLKLISSDENLIKKFVNTLVQIQDQYRIRAFKEMPNILRDAENLKLLLIEEYELN